MDKMEKQALAGLKKQWVGIQALGEVLDALRVEERSGVDLGDLAVQELERYAAENEQLKLAAAQRKEAHAHKVEELDKELHAQRDRRREQEHAASLEAHRLQTEATDLKHRNEMLEHRLKSQETAVEAHRRQEEQQQLLHQDYRAQAQAQVQTLQARCDALARERDEAQRQCAAQAQQLQQLQLQLQSPPLEMMHATGPQASAQPRHPGSGHPQLQQQFQQQQQQQQQQRQQHDPVGQADDSVIEMLMLLPPKMWNAGQVSQWVGAQPPASGLRQYATVLAQNDVDGDVLLTLNAGDLGEMRISNAQHRKSLLAAIASLKGDGGAVTSAQQQQQQQQQRPTPQTGSGKKKKKKKR